MKLNFADDLCVFIRSELVGEDVIVLPETSFDALGLDSFSIIEIILFCERKFEIILPDMELTKENLFSSAALAACLEKYKQV